jgi:AcrR family transcriptional regulator
MAIRSEARRAQEQARLARASMERRLRDGLERGAPRAARPEVVWLRLATLSTRARRELDRIVEAAIALADRDGLEALSMRRLATELNTGTTTLYRYVTGRDELLELMVDAVNAGGGGEGDLSRPISDWRDGLRRVANGARSRLLAHPWLSSQLLTRPTIGPNTLRGAEFVISITMGLVGDATTAASITSTLLAYVQGAAVAELAEREAQRRTGLDEHAWRETIAPWVRSIIEDARFPAFAQVVVAADDLSFEDRFVFGLERVLDGFERFAEGRSTT